MTTKHPSIKKLKSELDKTLENFKTERSSQLKEIENLKKPIEEKKEEISFRLNQQKSQEKITMQKKGIITKMKVIKTEEIVKEEEASEENQ